MAGRPRASGMGMQALSYSPVTQCQWEGWYAGPQPVCSAQDANFCQGFSCSDALGRAGRLYHDLRAVSANTECSYVPVLQVEISSDL